MFRAFILFACMAIYSMAIPFPRHVFDLSSVRNTASSLTAEVRTQLDNILYELNSQQVAIPRTLAKMAHEVEELKRSDVLLQMSIERCGVEGC